MLRAANVRWLLLLVLAWSQIAFAAHQVEHSIAEADEPCVVCLNFERDEDAALDAHHSVSERASALPAPAATQRCHARETFTHYRSRASP
ncbi:MAG: hypothetical protein AAFX58_07440 [Pseudomonadota bacterium]